MLMEFRVTWFVPLAALPINQKQPHPENQPHSEMPIQPDLAVTTKN